jgi:hypothetical protein
VTSKPRLPRGKIVTMCAAVINEERNQPKAILAVNDTRFSWGELSMDSGWKMQTVHRRWRVMFAGPVSPVTALIDAVKTEVASAKTTPYRAFARQCAKAYREERRRLIESEILGEHDIHSYAEYEALKNTSDNALYEAIREKIKKEEQEWNLLFIGFDDVGKPHIFVITEYGKIQWCDLFAFAAIGSGAWIAHHALAQFGYNRFMARSEATYGLLAAKFASESADGVGKKTGFLILKDADRLGRTVPGLNVKDIRTIKQDWEGLPRYSPTILSAIDKMLAESQAQHQPRIDNPLKGYIKRSTSRKSRRGK